MTEERRGISVAWAYQSERMRRRTVRGGRCSMCATFRQKNINYNRCFLSRWRWTTLGWSSPRFIQFMGYFCPHMCCPFLAREHEWHIECVWSTARGGRPRELSVHVLQYHIICSKATQWDSPIIAFSEDTKCRDHMLKSLWSQNKTQDHGSGTQNNSYAIQKYSRLPRHYP